jgi:hypothetical protein
MKNYKVVDTNTKNTYWMDTIDEVTNYLINIDVDFRDLSKIGNYQHGLIMFKKAERKANEIIFDGNGIYVTNMIRENNLNILLDNQN